MRMIKIKLVSIFTLLLITTTFAQEREFRAAWTASFYNLDWPSSRNLTVEQQKNELISILNKLESININALLFQVRPECDALYNSAIEPWSYWLTGTQGSAPGSGFDPLEYVIEEAHKRGIELHAWLNPYRAESYINRFPLAANHVASQHPDWILTFNSINLRMLDPGKSLVRAYLISIVNDIVNRYDVDGIVFDDYFYPYPNSGAGFSGITNEDATTFATEPRGFTSLLDWRRDNINLLISEVNTSIKAIKPYVKFGVSPFGIWKNGVPAGITGLDAYSSIYCDAVQWLNAQSVDYISPQLYWPLGGSQDYNALMNWWASQTNGRHLYISHALSKYSTWNSNEIPNQISLNRANANCGGSVFFRSEYFDINPHNIVNTLQTNYYQNPALLPVMSWLNGTAPNPPSDLQVSSIYNGNMLSWNLPADNNLKFFVIYRSSTSPVDITNPSNVLEIISAEQTYFNDVTANNNTTYYYTVTTVNKFDLESSGSIEVVSNTNLNFSILDNFESSIGHFDKQPTYSGSTSGISSSSNSARITSGTLNESSGALQVVLKDDASSNSNWYVRLLSGTGVVGNNIPVNNTYSIGYWAKTNNAPDGAQISLLMRDEGTLEQGKMLNIINDDKWHLYKWDLQDASMWDGFTGNGVIDGNPVTLDAIVFTAPNASPDWTILIEDVHAEELTPLPVELLNFEAVVQNSEVKLFWQTSMELNNYGFSVERSFDLLTWDEITFILGHGNSNSIKRYSASDKIFNTGKVYYRLKQIDIDGGFEYSRTISVSAMAPESFEVSQNYPNPFNPATTIDFKIPQQSNVTLKVYNTIGEIVAVLVNNNLDAGSHSVVFNASNLPSGVYIYRIETDFSAETKKMTLLK